MVLFSEWLLKTFGASLIGKLQLILQHAGNLSPIHVPQSVPHQFALYIVLDHLLQFRPIVVLQRRGNPW
jgi:hypothetical protein